jgi:hypothetical protein
MMAFHCESILFGSYRGDHGQDGPGARVEGHHGPLAVSQSLGRGPLDFHLYGELEIGPTLVLAEYLAPRAGHAKEPRLAGELFVVHTFQAGTAVAEAVVPKPRRGEAPQGIFAEIVLPLTAVLRELLAIGRQDEAPLDLHLLLDRPGVGRVHLQARRRPYLDIGEHEDEPHEQGHKEVEEPADGPIHSACPADRGRSLSALSLARSSSASRTKLATTELPP